MYFGIGYDVRNSQCISQAERDRTATVKFVPAVSRQAVEQTVVTDVIGKRKFLKPSQNSFNLLVDRLVHSISQMRYRGLNFSFEEHKKHLYVSCDLKIYSSVYTLRFKLRRLYDRAPSIGGVRNLLRGKITASLGALKNKVPTRKREPKTRLSRGQAREQAIARFSNKARENLRELEVAESRCQCYMIYYPEIFPTEAQVPGFTPEEVGALLRFGRVIQLRNDLYYIYQISDRYPLLLKGLQFDTTTLSRLRSKALAYRRKIFKEEFLYDEFEPRYIRENFGSRYFRIPDHSLHLNVPSGADLTEFFGDPLFASFDYLW